MSLLEAEKTSQADPSDHADAAAINDLRVAFVSQRSAFAADRQPSLAERRERVERIIPMMLINRERIGAALIADFGAPRGRCRSARSPRRLQAGRVCAGAP